MESRRRKAKPGSTRRVNAKIVPSELPQPSAAGSLALPNLEAFLEGDGPQISIGTIGPIRCAAVANDEHNMLAALVRRPGETLQQLLERLDAAVYLALEEERFTDEINSPPPRN
ncbi:MAG TPA: hypothetical protein VFL57_12985 [Bryobacteraceae bacterium]|nr:hypothetical protein [Bryobacteraceae bacterium]